MLCKCGRLIELRRDWSSLVDGERTVNPVMRIGVTCLLAVGSLCALGEDAKIAPEIKPQSAPPPKSASKLDDKLDWNVEPIHWEGLLGLKTTVDSASGPAVELAARAKSATDYDLTHSAGEKASAVDEARVESILRKAVPQ